MFTLVYYSYLTLINSCMHMHFLNRVIWLFWGKFWILGWFFFFGLREYNYCACGIHVWGPDQSGVLFDRDVWVLSLSGLTGPAQWSSYLCTDLEVSCQPCLALTFHYTLTFGSVRIKIDLIDGWSVCMDDEDSWTARTATGDTASVQARPEASRILMDATTRLLDRTFA